VSTIDASRVPGGLTEAERERFDRDGYLVVEGALQRGEVDAVRRELAAAAAGAEGYGYDHQAGELLLAGGGLRSVANPLAVAPVVLDVALHPGFFPRIAGLFGGAVRLLSNEYFITPAGARPRLGWHRDATDENFPTIELGSSLLLVNCLVLLSDVDSRNGPTLAVPGSQRWGRDHPLPAGALGNPDPRTLAGHVELGGGAGTAVFFDARLLHAQSENASDVERHALVFVYGYRWMRAFPGFEPTAEQVAALGGTPLRDQVLGVGPAFDDPVAAYEVPARWS
jgi:ectoine hydroxylase